MAYCDGMSVKTFVDETRGQIATEARGSRMFYWDTVFVPKGIEGAIAGNTYAEISDNPSFGLEFKVLKLSQSTLAMVEFLEYFSRAKTAQLWR